MLQVPKPILNTNLPSIHNAQNPHTHFVHPNLIHILTIRFTHPHLQIYHHRTRATPRHWQLLRKPPLAVGHKPHLPHVLHHRENPSPPSQHHVPHHPHLFHHFPQNGVVATHAEAKTPWMIRTLLGIEVNRINDDVIGEKFGIGTACNHREEWQWMDMKEWEIERVEWVGY